MHLAAQLARRPVEDAASRAPAGPPSTCAFTIFHRRFMNRNAPSTPSSDHSKVCSGGTFDIVKRRAVSAP
jgi:hypothetical protein